MNLQTNSQNFHQFKVDENILRNTFEYTLYIIDQLQNQNHHNTMTEQKLQPQKQHNIITDPQTYRQTNQTQNNQTKFIISQTLAQQLQFLIQQHQQFHTSK